METAKSIILFWNGNSAVFDENGQQISELQTGWLEIYFKFLLENGVNLEDIEIQLPFEARKAKPFKTPDGYNWKIE